MNTLQLTPDTSYFNSTDHGYTTEAGHVTIASILRSVSFAATGVVVLLSNLCSLIIIHRQHGVFGESSRHLYQVLAVADMCGGLTGCISNSILFLRHSWPFSNISCKIITWLFPALVQTSIIALSCISIDRYIAISRPLHYPILVTTRRTTIWFGLMLLIPLSIFISGFIPNTPLYTFAGYTCYSSHGTSDRMTFSLSSIATAALSALLFVSVPSLLGFILNCGSMKISIHQARAVAAQQAVVGANRIKDPPVDYKGVKTLILIGIVNAISWLPASVLFLYPVLGSPVIPIWPHFILRQLTMVTFWSNALIFARTNKTYRRAGRLLLRSIFCRELSWMQVVHP